MAPVKLLCLAVLALSACSDLPPAIGKAPASADGAGDGGAIDDGGIDDGNDTDAGTETSGGGDGTTGPADTGEDVGETAGGEPCAGVELPGGITPLYPAASRTVPGLGFESIDIRSPRTTCAGYTEIRCHETLTAWELEVRLSDVSVGTHASGTPRVGAFGECWTGNCAAGNGGVLEDCAPLSYTVEIYEVTDDCIAGRVDFVPALEPEGESPIDELYFLAPRCG